MTNMKSKRSNRKVNVAVVGLGFMGVTHIKTYLKIKAAKIVAVCDSVRLPVNGVLAGVAGNITGSGAIDLGRQVKVYRALSEVLADPEVDLVDLCVPTPMHPEQAIAELKPPPQVPQPQLRLGDLLVESGIVSRESVEKVVNSPKSSSTLVRIGKQLLDAHLIDDTNLYNALRCQSLFREGILCAQQTVAALSCAHDEKMTLEDAFAQCGINAPMRMQWNWQ